MRMEAEKKPERNLALGAGNGLGIICRMLS